MKREKALFVIALLSLISIAAYAFVLESDTYETEKTMPYMRVLFLSSRVSEWYVGIYLRCLWTSP